MRVTLRQHLASTSSSTGTRRTRASSWRTSWASSGAAARQRRRRRATTAAATSARPAARAADRSGAPAAPPAPAEHPKRLGEAPLLGAAAGAGLVGEHHRVSLSHGGPPGQPGRCLRSTTQVPGFPLRHAQAVPSFLHSSRHPSGSGEGTSAEAGDARDVASPAATAHRSAARPRRGRCGGGAGHVWRRAFIAPPAASCSAPPSA